MNIEALIRSLDKPYQAIRDAGVITYKTPPQGTQSDPVLTLKMRSEGISLTFDNDSNSKPLIEVSLELASGKKKGGISEQSPFTVTTRYVPSVGA